jgi:hypothetical protein
MRDDAGLLALLQIADSAFPAAASRTRRDWNSLYATAMSLMRWCRALRKVAASAQHRNRRRCGGGDRGAWHGC